MQTQNEFPTRVASDKIIDFDPGEAGPQAKYENDRELLASEIEDARLRE